MKLIIWTIITLIVLFTAVIIAVSIFLWLPDLSPFNEPTFQSNVVPLASMVAAWTTLLVVLAAFCTISNANKRNETELNNRLLSDIINWAIEIYDKVPEGRIFEGVANNQELIRKLEGIFKTYPGRDIYIKRISSGFNDERLNDEINNLTNALEHHRKEIRVLTSISETEIEDTVERTWKLIHDMSNIEGFSDGVISIASSLMK